MEYVKDASLIVNQEGNVISLENFQKTFNHQTTNLIDWYLDPFCPFCVRLDTQEKDRLKTMLKETNSMVRFHFVSFLNERTPNHYSKMAGGYMLAVGSVRNDLFLDFMHGVMNQEFHPTMKVQRDHEDFKKLFLSLGGIEKEWVKVQELLEEFEEQADVLTEDFFADETLAKKSPLDQEAFVPFVFVNDQDAFNVYQMETFPSFIEEEVK